MKEVLDRPVLDFFRRSYYSLFVAEVQNHGKKWLCSKHATPRFYCFICFVAEVQNHG
jgi:hypothetical protein